MGWQGKWGTRGKLYCWKIKSQGNAVGRDIGGKAFSCVDPRVALPRCVSRLFRDSYYYGFAGLVPEGRNVGRGSAVAGTAKFPENARAKRPRHKTSGLVTGPDSVARYFREDETGRRTIIEEWGDRVGKPTSPANAVMKTHLPQKKHSRKSTPQGGCREWR
jgi:hypothetical protein